MDDVTDIAETIRKRQELQDHGHEIAGLDTGRMARFGVGHAQAQDLKEREKKELAYRDALDRLLATDPEYRKLYEELGDKLRKAETTADTAIETIRLALMDLQEANADMRDRAPKIDGKAVFRYADGRVVDEDGNEIDGVIAAGIIWPDDTPSAEDYFASVKREGDLAAKLDDWQAYRNDTLGDIRNRYDDRENPMSKDDLRDDIEIIDSGAPDNPLEAETTHKSDLIGRPSAVLIPSLGD